MDITASDDTGNEQRAKALSHQRDVSASSIAKPVRPAEFSLWASVTLLLSFLALAASLGIVFSKAHDHGKSVAHNVLAMRRQNTDTS